jgi:hypothetical protein
LIALAAADQNAVVCEREHNGVAQVSGCENDLEVAALLFHRKFIRRILRPQGVAELDVFFDLQEERVEDLR